MSWGPLIGGLVGLAVVLGAFALAVRALNHFARGVGGNAGLPLEVVARLGLGPRQGLAIVRVGERAVVVSLGEGGVRPVLELDPEEAARLHAPNGVPSPPTQRLRERVRAGVRGLFFVFLLVGTAVSVSPSLVWADPVAPTAHAQQPAGPAQAATPAASGASIDSVAAGVMPPLSLTVGDEDDSPLRLTGTVGTVIVIGLLTLLPTLLLLMTSFTRILVVLQFLRQAMGTQSAPPGHLLAALALLLTGFVMAPTFGEVNEVALAPWLDDEIEEGEMLQAAVVPFREFMLRQTSERELGTFLEMSESPPPETADEVPLVVLVSAFTISELRTAFQIGFAIFLPFVIIDLVVASVLTSMGMFMLPPMMVALPLKMMLFVLVDGWSLVVQGIVSSFV